MSTIRLVPLSTAHAEALRETMHDPDVRRNTRTPDPMPEGWVEEWLTGFADGHRAGWAIEDEHGTFLGYAVTGPIDLDGREIELGYALAPGARGRGVATATLAAMSRWAFETGMIRVTALISVDNPASSRVAQKCGYTYEGVLRSMHHVGDQRVDLQSWSILPGELPGGLTYADLG